MKRTIEKIVTALLLVSLCACSTEQSARTGAQSTSKDVTDVIEDLAEKEDQENTEVKEEKETEEVQEQAEPETSVRLMEWQGNVDIDLTEMNPTMIYSEVYNMMMDPVEYIGKTIRIFGTYAHAFEEQNQQHYYACVVQDATACCAQGLEFVLDGSYVWPDDYPEEGDEVVVTGVLHLYSSDMFKVLQLDDAVIESHTPKA